MAVIKETTMANILHKGKVRDTYDIGNNELLMIATDRISAFDLVLPTAIPEKGTVLNQMSAFWFNKTSHVLPNHFVCLATEREELSLPLDVARRGMVVKKADRIDIECVVRGYITGSAWSEYRKQGTVSGEFVGEGLQECERFPTPLFTPTTKAEIGHDENITHDEIVTLIGEIFTQQLKDISLSIYAFACEVALEKGIIIADTKMEFGIIEGQLTLIDEIFTPDSSRFWSSDGYALGQSQPNFDKQFVRDWLDDYGWNHEPPVPELPEDVVLKTQQRYMEAFTLLTGYDLDT